MSVQYALLGLLQQKSDYGYELKKRYDDLFGKDKPILSGQIYSSLNRLQRDELIVAQDDDAPSGGPARIKYAITDKGRTELQNWQYTPEAPVPHLQATLYLKTVLALFAGDADLYLDRQRRAHIERMRELTKEKQEQNISQQLLVDHALFHLNADLKWIEIAIQKINLLQKEITND